MTFVSPAAGLVLGLSLCGGVACLRLAVTADSGARWSLVPADGLAILDATQRWQVRFADASDGWISGGRLLATHDGGRSWHEVHLPGLGTTRLGEVGTLEAADGRVFAEVSEGTNGDTGGPVVLFDAAVHSDSWQAVSGVATGLMGYPGVISVADGSVWAVLHPATWVGDAIDSQSAFFHSSDGTTWRGEPMPWPSQTVADLAAASRSQVLVVCLDGVAAGSQDKSAYVSNDDGRTYIRVADPPFSGDFTGVAAAPYAFAIATASGASGIDVSRDTGQTWDGALGFGDGGLGFSDLGFTTPTQGVAIHGMVQDLRSLQLLMTFDAWQHWHAVTVSLS